MAAINTSKARVWLRILKAQGCVNTVDIKFDLRYGFMGDVGFRPPKKRDIWRHGITCIIADEPIASSYVDVCRERLRGDVRWGDPFGWILGSLDRSERVRYSWRWFSEGQKLSNRIFNIGLVLELIRIYLKWNRKIPSLSLSINCH